MSDIAIIMLALVRYGPAVAQMVQQIFTLKEPTQADWDKLWALTQVPFDTLVPKKNP